MSGSADLFHMQCLLPSTHANSLSLEIHHVDLKVRENSVPVRADQTEICLSAKQLLSVRQQVQQSMCHEIIRCASPWAEGQKLPELPAYAEVEG